MAVAFGEMPDQMPNAERQMPNQFVAIANAAIQIVNGVKELDFKSLLSLQVPSISSSDSESLQVRIGIHCGPITAGVLGTERLQYDVWGDTVNVASRLESTSEPNRIHISSSFALALQGDEVTGSQGDKATEVKGDMALDTRHLKQEIGTWHMALRGQVEVKGKGMMTTYWLS